MGSASIIPAKWLALLQGAVVTLLEKGFVFNMVQMGSALPMDVMQVLSLAAFAKRIVANLN